MSILMQRHVMQTQPPSHPVPWHTFSVLFLAIFVSVTGVGIVVPLLPVYAHAMGAGGFAVGMIFGAFSISRSFLLPFVGGWSDRVGRKPFIVTGLAAYTLVSLAFILFNTVTGLIMVRFFQGIASALILPVAQAYVGDITPPGKEGFLMGLFNLSMFSSLSIGPMVGGLVNDRFGLTTAFVIMGLLSLVAVLAAGMLLPPTREEVIAMAAAKPASWKTILRTPAITSLFLFRLGYTLCIGIIWGFLPIYAADRFDLPSFQIGMLIMTSVFVSGIIHLPMGILADKISKHLLMAAGALLVICAMPALASAHGFIQLLLCVVCFGLGGGISMPALMALAVIQGNRMNAIGSVMSLLTVAHSLGMMGGALLAGAVMDHARLSLAFPMGGGLMLAGVAGFATLQIRSNWRK